MANESHTASQRADTRTLLLMHDFRSRRMKYAALILAMCFGFICHPFSIQSADIPLYSALFVYKLDGTKHCESSAGISLDSMAHELAGGGIEVLSSQKGFDGREGIAFCGTPTGQINIYEIPSSDLKAALRLGFKKLPQNLNINIVKHQNLTKRWNS